VSTNIGLPGVDELQAIRDGPRKRRD
jgi:hypothetical protein